MRAQLAMLSGLVLALSDCHPGAQDWQVGLKRVGRLQYGMNQSEAAKAFGLPGDAAPTVGGCRNWSPAGTPGGLHFLIENGRVVRVDVDSGTVTTTEGAGIGTSEENVQRLYAGHIETRPHKYQSDQGWHYLVYRAAESADSAYRIVFETDGRQVRSFRAGLEPAVEYVEGCG